MLPGEFLGNSINKCQFIRGTNHCSWEIQQSCGTECSVRTEGCKENLPLCEHDFYGLDGFENFLYFVGF
jgi:hypothetical protein